MNASPILSVIVPCYNEEEGIVECHARLSSVLQSMDVSYEIVYVDDNSKDRTATVLHELSRSEKNVRVLYLSRNFGHQIAVSAGLDAVEGLATVIIDADLQDPPELIPRMFDLWQDGAQVVYGVRTTRAGETAFKIWTARLFYRLINKLSEVEIPLDTGDFRLIDRCVVKALCEMPERHRLLRGMSSWIGYTQVGLPYDRSPRHAGATNYPFNKMLSLAVDGIVSFSTVPLRIVTMVGFFSAAVACAGIVYSLLVRMLTHSWVRGWAISFAGMMFMAGVQLLCLGILGEYIGRIYTESKLRPLYLLRDFHSPKAVNDERLLQPEITVLTDLSELSIS